MNAVYSQVLALLFILGLGFSVQSCRKEAKFRGNNGFRGNTAPLNPPVDLSKEPIDPSLQDDAPKPGQGADPNTGEIPENDEDAFLTNYVFELTCNDGVNIRKPLERSIKERISAVVKGEICLESKAGLSVVFVLDYSGSMGPHFDADTNSESPGNDPLVSNSCGRLEAAKAVLSRISKESAVPINVALVPFSNRAIEPMVVRPTALADFNASYLSKQYFCRYVAQSEKYQRTGESLSADEYGSALSADSANTNYEAAFQRLEEALKPQSGSLVQDHAQVFFISDGEPLAPGTGSQPIVRAETAARSLRQNAQIKNLSVNGLYLGVEDSKAFKQAAGVMEKLTGSAARVRQATSASDLADQVVRFPAPEINLDAARYGEMARVAVAPYGEKALGIRSLSEADGNRWVYYTQPFILLGKPDEKVENKVFIDIFGDEGFRFKTDLTIEYTQSTN